MTAYQRARFMERYRSTANDEPRDGSTRGLWAAILGAALAGASLWALLGVAVVRVVREFAGL